MAIIYGKFGANRSETITGTAGNDEIYPLGGNDYIDGGRGTDTVYVEALSTAFKISTVNGTTYLDATSGASTGQGVTLRNTEYVRFTDKTINLIVNDRFVNTPQADFFDGGPGTDTTSFAGNRADYSFKASTAGSALTVTVSRKDATESSDFLTSVERLEFGQQRVALDLEPTESAGQAVLLIGAVLGKNLLPAKQPLMGVVIDLFDQGFTLPVLAGALMRLPIWGGVLTPTDSATDIARYLLTTVHQRPPTEAEVAAGAASIQNDAQGAFLANLATSAANQSQVDLVGLASAGFFYEVVPGG